MIPIQFSPEVQSCVLSSSRPFEWFIFQNTVSDALEKLKIKPMLSFPYAFPVAEKDHLRIHVGRFKMTESTYTVLVTHLSTKATDKTWPVGTQEIQWNSCRYEGDAP